MRSWARFLSTATCRLPSLTLLSGGRVLKTPPWLLLCPQSKEVCCNMRKENKFASLATVCAAATLLLVLAGCAGIEVKSNDSDKSGKNVEINTPVGGLKVRKEVDLKALGLTPYPNAKVIPDDENSKGAKDTGANVNISTPFFALKVRAPKYESDDAPDKIIEFYKKDMARYG